MRSLTLRLDIASYWLHACGEGGGADFDLVMETDRDGLPLLRGRHVAGLVRLALERAERWRWFDEERQKSAIAALIDSIRQDEDNADLAITELLMGARAGKRRSRDDAGEGPGVESVPGVLAVTSATVSRHLREAFRDGERNGESEVDGATRAALLRRIDSTAIDEIRGVARQAHLRSVEAAIPLPLEFTVSFASEDLAAWVRNGAIGAQSIEAARERWPQWLEIAWPALDEVGAKRTRGFGRLRYADFAAATEAQS